MAYKSAKAAAAKPAAPIAESSPRCPAAPEVLAGFAEEEEAEEEPAVELVVDLILAPLAVTLSADWSFRAKIVGTC
jgi:hypothetical protein